MGAMISFHKPSAQVITAFLASQSKLDFSYPSVGATATDPPAGYNLDRQRIKLGEGRQVFLSAKAALEDWAQFRLGWVEAISAEPSLRVGGVVAVTGRGAGLWWTNACRIIYLVEENGPVYRFGFGYGTLPGHIEMGEERFLIEWNPDDDSVWYDILAFSKPHGFLAKVGDRKLRAAQARFRRDSGAAMVKAVNHGSAASAK